MNKKDKVLKETKAKFGAALEKVSNAYGIFPTGREEDILYYVYLEGYIGGMNATSDIIDTIEKKAKSKKENPDFDF